VRIGREGIGGWGEKLGPKRSSKKRGAVGIGSLYSIRGASWGRHP